MRTKPRWYLVLLIVGLLSNASAGSKTARRIAVLDFELNNLSPLPTSNAEWQRTQSIAPLLRRQLARLGDYALIEVPKDRQSDANAGAGYLAMHADSAAALGAEVAADWVVVGRLQKSNDLFAYLTVDLISVRETRHIAALNTEIKGPVVSIPLTQRGVARLAQQIDRIISHGNQPARLVNSLQP